MPKCEHPEVKPGKHCPDCGVKVEEEPESVLERVVDKVLGKYDLKLKETPPSPPPPEEVEEETILGSMMRKKKKDK